MSAVALDFEATGPEAHKRDIIEIGAVRIINGQVREEQILNQRILPRDRITFGAWQVHHIRRRRLLRSPALESFWPALDQFLGQNLIVGHDVKLLRHQLRRLGIRWRPNPALCTGFMHMRATGRPDPPALDDLAEQFGVPKTNRHTGLGDAVMSAHVMAALAPLLERRGIVTVADALAAQRPLHLRHAQKARANRAKL